MAASSTTRRVALAAGLTLAAWGCEAERFQGVDAGLDARVPDAGPADVPVSDTFVRDARPADAAVSDTFVRDAGPADAAVPDTFVRDAGPADAAVPDTFVRDAAACGPEACTGRDDDCDGRVDEGAACVGAVRAGCRLWLGFAPAGQAPVGPGWGACPAVEADRAGAAPCASSRGTGRFYSFALGATPGAGDVLGVAWTCGDDAVGRWAQAHCAVTLAAGKAPVACPPVDDQGACARTAGGGAFVALALPGPLDGDAGLGVAFSCEDDDLPDRAAGVAAGVTLWVASQYRHEGAEGCLDEDLFDDAEAWGACPGLAVDAEGRHRCASTAGDGGLHGFALGEGGAPTLGPCSGLGVAVR